MTVEIDCGVPFAYGFFDKQLADSQPSTVFSFSRSVHVRADRWRDDSTKINILWKSICIAECFPDNETNPIQRGHLERLQARDIRETDMKVRENYPRAVYRGIFTTENYLLAKLKPPSIVVGPLIVLKDYQNGPIHRVDPPRNAEERWRLRTGRVGDVLIRRATLGDS